MERRGNFFIISGLSGIGKDSLIYNLIDSVPRVVRGRKYTTREPRMGELKSTDYDFISEELFEKKKGAGLLFASYVRNNYRYALNKEQILDATESSYDIVTIFSDYPQIPAICREMEGEGVLTYPILVLADEESIARRLRHRVITHEDRENRLREVRKDLEYFKSKDFHIEDYSYTIFNGDDKPLKESTRELDSIVLAHREVSNKKEKEVAGKLRADDISDDRLKKILDQ